jgi:hypothetical protein
MSVFTFENWWVELLRLAPTEYIEEIMYESKPFYQEYFKSGMTPEQAFNEDWGNNA